MSTMIVFAMCAGLVYLLQLFIFRRIWSRGLSVAINFTAQEAVVGQEASLEEVITNRKWFPIPILHIKFQLSRNLRFHSMNNAQVSDLLYKNDMFSLLFYQRITRTLPFTCERRGYYTVTQADAVAYTLFFTGRLVKQVPQSTELYVFPEPLPAELLDIPFQRMMGELVTRRFLYQDPFVFKGIRDYTIYDPLKTVNWKASARTGGLKTNTYEYTAGQQICILLNLEDESVWREEQLLETGISLAAALSERFLSVGIPVSIYTNGLDLETLEPVSLVDASGITQVRQAKRRLSRIDLTQKVLPFSTLAARVQERTEELSSSCLLVISYCRQEETAQSIRTLAAKFPGLFWLLPLYSEDDALPAGNRNMTIMKWEVRKKLV